MGSVVSTDKLEAEAAAWLIRCENHHATGEDRASLANWLATSAQHRAAYLRLRSSWERAEQFRRLRPLDGKVNANLLTESILPSLQRADRPAGPGSFLKGVPRAWKYAYRVIGAVLLLVALGFAVRAIAHRFR